jgi:hypothetical protein
MSSSVNDCAAIGNVGKTLISLLWNSIKDDSRVNGIITSDKQISLSSPKDVVESNASEKLSMFLYYVTEFSSMKNVPLNGSNKQYPPLYLTLHYLIVPYTQNVESDQILLGKIMQVFVDNPVLRGSILQGSLADNGADLRVVMDSLSVDDLNKLWTVLSTPYKLAVSYSVSPVKIEPTREEEETRVLEKRDVYQAIY